MKVELDLDMITSEMDELKDMEARLKFELKNTQDKIGKLEIKLQTLLEQAGVDSMDFGIYSFGWTTKTRKAFSQKEFGKAHPDLLEQFKIESKTKTFEFKINS